jgi:phosphoglycerate dehydrogenase-like enzyme
MPPLRAVIIAHPNARYLSVLEQLPDSTTITVGATPEAFRTAAPEADLIFSGMNVGGTLREIWPQAAKVRWVHSMSAGVEGLLFPELIESDVPVTNARGVFAESLGEFVLASMLFYAKDLRRMVRNQLQSRWEQFDVDVLYEQTLGIVGYGEIGRAAARRAKAMGMKVFALRRRTSLAEGDPLVDRIFSPENRAEMMALCDYVAVAAPLTHETRGMIGETEIGAMKPSGVLINVGRGPVINEQALIAALKSNKIRGAALDVFDKEPLPENHPYWSMENVLLSPHCADHTASWLEEAMQLFVKNFFRFERGEPLLNVIDKRAGY